MRLRVSPLIVAALVLLGSTGSVAGAQVVAEIPRSPSWTMVPPKPGPGYGWVGGHWQWNGARYAWIAGHYEKRPFPEAHWVAGHWEREPGGWTYVDGYWSHAARRPGSRV